MTTSSPKRYSQRQLTKIFCIQAGIPEGQTVVWQLRWWANPTNPNSLRLNLAGLQFVKTTLKLVGYEFVLNDDLTNLHILQLERVFRGMYYLLHRHKIIVFDDEEAVMLSLHANDLAGYLSHLAVSQEFK